MTMRTTELDSAGGAGYGLREDCCGERGMAARSMADLMLSNLRMPGVPDLLDGGAGEDRSVRQRDAVDLLVVGSIATGDPGQPVAGAMGVKDGRVVALGSADELQGLRGTDTELVKVGDGVVIPGLIEPHMHLWSTGVFFGMADCSLRKNPVSLT
jgi:hypothetical protein